VSYVTEYPTPERLTELWPQIEPLFERCCRDAADGELDAEDIRRLHAQGHCFVFVDSLDGVVTLAAAVEFIPYPKFVAANVFALGGKGLLNGSAERSWKLMKAWMVANKAVACDAWVSDSMARVLKKKLGFSKTYNHMRLRLEETPCTIDTP